MMTQTHVLLGSAIFSRKGMLAVSIAAIIGGMLPDIYMFVSFPFAVFVLGIEARAFFDHWYFTDWVQVPNGISNSIPIYLILIGLGVALKKHWLWALAGAALLHCLGDLPLHNDDGHMHFYPLSRFQFQSPVSYWDSDHYADWWRPVEVLMGLICCYVLARRHPVLWNIGLMAILGLFYIFIFASPYIFGGPGQG